MSAGLIAIIGIMYFVVAIDLYMRHNLGLSIAFLGYAIGNIGLYISAK